MYYITIIENGCQSITLLIDWTIIILQGKENRLPVSNVIDKTGLLLYYKVKKKVANK